MIILSSLIIHSACPEKILEFEENKVQRKKQNIQKRRPKKKETVVSTAELDLDLQNFLLDNNNLGDQTNLNATVSSEKILEETTALAEVDLNTTDLLLSHEIEHIRLIQNISNLSNKEAVSSIDKNVVIDLLSPTPLKSSHTSKFRDQHIEVINLSDSENDVSPEHKQKAKELRKFLASIRNQIH